jgi:DUF1680 family protein
MIRACGDFLVTERDPALEARLDGYVERIAAAAARDPDGYLNTHTQLVEPEHRWGTNDGNDNWQHDVYNAGGMVEAAVHYYQATGKTRLLSVATQLANHMCDFMGPPPRHNVVPGHSIAEEAMVTLYLLYRAQPELKQQMPVPVDEERYLRLAEFWIENRGHHEGRRAFGSYGQDHQPVLEQETIEGHAVRATLLCTGLVATALVNGRTDYLTAARRLWDNMVRRRMYITGGLGAVAGHEGFGADYELPNDGYLETCAAVGAGFFHHNLNLATAEAQYADELERTLYNGVVCGVSLTGENHFYENPLEGEGRRRWAWHNCPCCPPMFLKIMGALPGYIYAQDSGGVYVNLFLGSQADIDVSGTAVRLAQATGYPWDGKIRVEVSPERPAEFAVNLRLPGWSRRDEPDTALYRRLGDMDGAEFELRVNGQTVGAPEIVRGYVRLQRRWQTGDVIEFHLPMPVQRMVAHPLVKADAGRVALMRGPLVYCVETFEDVSTQEFRLPSQARLTAEHCPDLLGGVTVVHTPGLDAIPYYSNANRAPAHMRVWLPQE